MRASGVLTIVLLAILSIVLGCGSSNTAMNPPPPPGRPSPTPTPTPGTAQWVSSVEGATGSVTVSAAGDVTVQVTKAAPSTTYVGNFCQFPGNLWNNLGLNPCFALQQSLITDASGNGQLKFHFPKSGVWSGAFNFAPGGDTNSSSRIDTDLTGAAVSLSSPLVPVSKANGGGPPGSIFTTEPQEPGTGSVSISGGNLTIKLTGATPNAKFIAGQSFADGGSASQQVGDPFTTDASGNVTVTIKALDSTGSMISVEHAVNPETAGLETGFAVP